MRWRAQEATRHHEHVAIGERIPKLVRVALRPTAHEALVHKWSIQADRPGKAMSVVWLQATRAETGMPRCVIRLITAQPVRASAFCPGRLRARKRRPIRVL